MIDIKESYDEQVREHLKKQFNYSNDMQIPRVVKVVVNMGMGESTSNSKAIENGVKELQTITGQKNSYVAMQIASDFIVRDSVKKIR